MKLNPKILFPGLLGLLSSALVLAQTYVSFGQEIPVMRGIVCNSLQAAQAFSRNQTSSTPGCFQTVFTVTPERLENSIPEFEGPVTTYDPAARQTINHTYQGRSVSIPVSVRNQRSRMYYSKIRLEDGTEGMGWVQIPNQPYHARFLECRSGRCPQSASGDGFNPNNVRRSDFSSQSGEAEGLWAPDGIGVQAYPSEDRQQVPSAPVVDSEISI
jgi:hypothetical protein